MDADDWRYLAYLLSALALVVAGRRGWGRAGGRQVWAALFWAAALILVSVAISHWRGGAAPVPPDPSDNAGRSLHV